MRSSSRHSAMRSSAKRLALRRWRPVSVVLALAAAVALDYHILVHMDLDAAAIASSIVGGSRIYYSALCNASFDADDASASLFRPNLPIIYFVTPTFSRPVQLAELIRLGQTLLHVPNLVWLVAEDRDDCSALVGQALERWATQVTHRSPKPQGGKRPYVHLISPMPSVYK